MSIKGLLVDQIPNSKNSCYENCRADSKESWDSRVKTFKIFIMHSLRFFECNQNFR